jgi:hypothetical protein
MDATNREPTRQLANYKKLTHFVIQNHARTESTKPKHKSSNLLDAFLTSKWVLWLFHYVKSRFGPRHKFEKYETSADKGIYKLYSQHNSGTITLALLADWGTDTEESKQVGLAVAHHKPDYSIHLGDTYYVGAPFEIKNNFTPGNSFWHYGSVGSFALPGNHEMYSNGGPYFDILLPFMGLRHPQKITQGASYFCLENEYWRIIGLDTGYRSVGIPFLEFFLSKANLRPEIIAWLNNDVKIKNDNRGLIILTHHQYISAFDKGFPSTAEQLKKIIGKNRKILWFWGHEHRFAMYGKYSSTKGITAYGRCIGHGGMPTSLVKENKKLKERNLVLYDNRIRKPMGKINVGHNGYSILSLNNENLRVDYYDEKKLLVTENWLYNKTEQAIEGISIINHCSDLQEQQNINQAIL